MTTPEYENAEQERLAQQQEQQKETQAAAGEPTEARESGSANAQNTPGPETQTR